MYRKRRRIAEGTGRIGTRHSRLRPVCSSGSVFYSPCGSCWWLIFCSRDSYLIPASLAHLGRWMGLSHFLPDPCSVSGLRAFNLVLSLRLPFLYSSLLALLDPQPPSPQPAKGKPSSLRRTDAAARREWEGLVVALFPMVGWWAWMFYTDLGSVALVLLSWRAALKRQYMASAMVSPTCPGR